ncbi:DUF1232 domain-containing protein [Clostridium sp. MSJ-8]|uniref:YkvA family protein n=1 Tax=Clostridium sp. MSJ-8 TaxID=2841510 RepID=UPI001C0E91C0|nr:DUF1232 domain-containing protein [Clostridium sp. MSJ-8]MBU5487345.1 DUF1232 domain-containing protein [Clostridium sp. MSJ-8]
MKVSKVQIQLTGADILSIINDFLDVDNLIIENIEISDKIYVNGNLKGIDFTGIIQVLGITEEKVNLKLMKLKVSKVGFFRPIRSLGLKYLFKGINIKGIESKKDEIFIDIKEILFDVPYVDLKVTSIFINEEFLCISGEDVEVSIDGNILKTRPVIEESPEVEEEINKVEDNYTIGREKVKEKMPKAIQGVSDYLLVIPDIIALICRILKDDRVSVKVKLIIAGAISYIVVPGDIIPDKIPFIGKIDDMAVAFFALNKIVTEVPNNIILENWQGDNDLVDVLNIALDYIMNCTKAKNVDKLYSLILKLSEL